MDEPESLIKEAINQGIEEGLLLPNEGNVLSLPFILSQRELGIKSKKRTNRKYIEKWGEEALISSVYTFQQCELPGTPKSTFLMVFSPDGTKVASTHGDHNVYVTDVSSGKCICTLKGHPRTPWSVAFHPSSNEIIASGCLGGQVRVWDLKGGSEVWTPDKKHVIASLAFHPTEQVLCIATDNEIYFWDWFRPVPFAKISTGSAREKIKYVKFDPLGYKLITGIFNVKNDYRRYDPLRSDHSYPTHGTYANRYRQRDRWRATDHAAPPDDLEANSLAPTPQGRDISRIIRELNEGRGSGAPVGGSSDPLNEISPSSLLNLESLGTAARFPREDEYAPREASRQNLRPSGGSDDSGSSSSMDSSSSVTSGVSRASRERNTRLSLLWTSRLNRQDSDGASTNPTSNNPTGSSSTSSSSSSSSGGLTNNNHMTMTTMSPSTSSSAGGGYDLEERRGEGSVMRSQELVSGSNPGIASVRPREPRERRYTSNPFNRLDNDRSLPSTSSGSPRRTHTSRSGQGGGGRWMYYRGKFHGHAKPRVPPAVPSPLRAGDISNLYRENLARNFPTRSRASSSREALGDSSLAVPGPSGLSTSASSSSQITSNPFLDPTFGVHLLSRHIENMQRICRSLTLPRAHLELTRHRHEITRLQQIRSMLYDIQHHIRSLRASVDQTVSEDPPSSLNTAFLTTENDENEALIDQMLNPSPERNPPNTSSMRDSGRAGSSQNPTSSVLNEEDSGHTSFVRMVFADQNARVPSDNPTQASRTTTRTRNLSRIQLYRHRYLVSRPRRGGSFSSIRLPVRRSRNRLNLSSPTNPPSNREGTSRSMRSRIPGVSSCNRSNPRTPPRRNHGVSRRPATISRNPRRLLGHTAFLTLLRSSQNNMNETVSSIRRRHSSDWQRRIRTLAALEQRSSETVADENLGGGSAIPVPVNTETSSISTEHNATSSQSTISASSSQSTRSTSSAELISGGTTNETARAIADEISRALSGESSRPVYGKTSPAMNLEIAKALYDKARIRSENAGASTSSSTSTSAGPSTSSSTSTSQSAPLAGNQSTNIRTTENTWCEPNSLTSSQVEENSGTRSENTSTIRFGPEERPDWVTESLALSSENLASTGNENDRDQSSAAATLRAVENTGSVPRRIGNSRSREEEESSSQSSAPDSPSQVRAASPRSSLSTRINAMMEQREEWTRILENMGVGISTSPRNVSNESTGTTPRRSSSQTSATTRNGELGPSSSRPFSNSARISEMLRRDRLRGIARHSARLLRFTAPPSASFSSPASDLLEDDLLQPDDSDGDTASADENSQPIMQDLHSLRREMMESHRHRILGRTPIVTGGELANATLSEISSTERYRTIRRERYRTILEQMASRLNRLMNRSLLSQGSRLQQHIDEEFIQLTENDTSASLRNSWRNDTPSSSTDHSTAFDNHMHNLRLLVRLALHLIYQLINFICNQNVSYEERPISRLPNPFREGGQNGAREEGASSLSNESNSFDLELEPGLRNLTNLLETVRMASVELRNDVLATSQNLPPDENPTAFASARSGSNRSEQSSTINGTNNVRDNEGSARTSSTTPSAVRSRLTSFLYRTGRNRFSNFPTNDFTPLTPEEVIGGSDPLLQRPLPTMPTTSRDPLLNGNNNPILTSSSTQRSRPGIPIPQILLNNINIEGSSDILNSPSGINPAGPSGLTNPLFTRRTPLRFLGRQNAVDRRSMDSDNDAHEAEILIGEQLDIPDVDLLREAEMPDENNEPQFGLGQGGGGSRPYQPLLSPSRAFPNFTGFHDRPFASIGRHPFRPGWMPSPPPSAPSGGAGSSSSNNNNNNNNGSSNRNPSNDPEQYVYFRSLFNPYYTRNLQGNENNIHRIQAWDFTGISLPDISNAYANIVVPKCKIHFDASVSISDDGTMLAALVPERPPVTRVCVYSLQSSSLGDTLYSSMMDSNTICVSISPTMKHLVIGIAFNQTRMGMVINDRQQVVASIYQMTELKKDEKKTAGRPPFHIRQRTRSLKFLRNIELDREPRTVSLNCIRWMPFPGQGLIYGTNRGQLVTIEPYQK